MRKLFIFCLCVFVVGLICFINKKLSDGIYQDCMDSGKNTEETCYFYSYNQ